LERPYLNTVVQRVYAAAKAPRWLQIRP
jgi:hypothetical protein